MDTISSFNGTNGLESLEKQMKSYVDDTLAFKRDAQKGGGPFVLTKDKVKNREVQIAIPEGTSKAKMQVIIIHQRVWRTTKQQTKVSYLRFLSQCMVIVLCTIHLYSCISLYRYLSIPHYYH